MTNTGLRSSQVRMGPSRLGRKRKLAAVTTALIAVLAAIFAVVFSGDTKDDNETANGCSTDSDCGAGRICAAGGCLLLIPDENPALWHNELQKQLDPKKSWEPYPAFGIKLQPRPRCDVPRENLELPTSAQVTVTTEASVYEVLPQGLWLHLYQTAAANIWIDAISWKVPAVSEALPGAVCAGLGVSAVDVESGADIRVDAALKHTVPVGGHASAEVSVGLKLPAANALGERTLVLPLAAKSETCEKMITAIAFPLGTDIAAMEGPVPRSQRLLKGFLTYYWEHKGRRSEAAIRFTLPAGKKTKRLDITSVRP